MEKPPRYTTRGKLKKKLYISIQIFVASNKVFGLGLRNSTAVRNIWGLLCFLVDAYILIKCITSDCIFLGIFIDDFFTSQKINLMAYPR